MPASRTLIFMRHAAAGHQGGTRDHDRPLTDHGIRDATAAGTWMRRNLPTIDAVVCSTARRTRQTLSATGINAPTTFSEELYGGGIDDILEQIAHLPDSAHTVLVVGHAPGIPSTAHELVTLAGGNDLAGGNKVADGPRSAELDTLRHFSACALAVMSTDASWAELAQRGADLQTVRHPDR